MLWFHYQEWSQETSKDRTTCQKCWAMHDDEFEDVDDQSDEDNGSDQIFSRVRTTCTIVPFWVSTCRNIHWCPTNLVTLIFIAINPRPFHPTLTSTSNSHCDWTNKRPIDLASNVLSILVKIISQCIDFALKSMLCEVVQLLFLL